jgi:hypothetical protein
MRCTAALASVLLPLAGCGDSAPSPPLGKAPVAKVLREWVGSARAEDLEGLCERTFMAYDAPRRLWPRIALQIPESPGYPPRAASPARLLQDCRDEFGHGGESLGASPRLVSISAIVIEGPVRDADGIERTARAHVTVRDRDQTADWRARLVLYRGRWRVLQGYD